MQNNSNRQESSLLRRVNRITTSLENKSTDPEEVQIHNTLVVMKEWGLNYEEVMHLPVPVKNEMLLYLKKLEQEREKEERDKKRKSMTKSPRGLNSNG